MAYLHTILAYPSKSRLKTALNRIHGYRAGKELWRQPSAPAPGFELRGILRGPPCVCALNQSRKGRKNPEPGTGVPGKETNGNQVPFRGRHNQRAGSPQFHQIIHHDDMSDRHQKSGANYLVIRER
jgi:hypothetical protein